MKAFRIEARVLDAEMDEDEIQEFVTESLREQGLIPDGVCVFEVML